MLNAILFGAAHSGVTLYETISKKYCVVAFTDNDPKKWGGKIEEISIIPPSDISHLKYDVIIITSAPGLNSIKEQCIQMGIDEGRIISSYVEGPLESRRIFLERFADLLKISEEEGAVAEVGVFEGDFAKYINQYFSNKTLYLFDTFEGFDDRDIQMEGTLSHAQKGDYANTSIEMVMKKMPHPDNVVIKKGYFPETAEGINEVFCFVNLDLDLYEPTLQGLRFFEDKMTANGVILVHDYFAENFKGPKEAVKKYISESERNIRVLPIGDGISIMIVLG